MGTLDKCAACGLSRAEHHDFDAVKVPDGCVCDPFEWRTASEVPPVCLAFRPAPYSAGVCESCEHDRGCHHAHAVRP